MWSSSAFFAASSMTGPTSVAKSLGSPTLSVSMAPAIILIMPSATSSWTNSTRRAEQRWPVLWKAEEMTSRVTCSGSADESTIIAFWPPVSATNGMIGPSRSASVRLIMRAVSVEPVKTTPASSGCAVSVPPTTLPWPGALAPRFRGVEAEEIDRLAHLENGIDQSLSAFTNAQREEFLAMLLVEVRGAIEQLGTSLSAQRIPILLRRMSGTHHPVDFGG